MIKRSEGRSAIACAAYRSGELLVDHSTGEAHDYSRRRDDIASWIQTPEQVPEWARNRSKLWNEVERSERRSNSQVAREVQLALPKELGREQQDELLRSYVQEHFAGRGMVADVNIHRGDHQNPHAHIMLTTRELEGDGFGAKNRDWNHTRTLQSWREGWERHANRELERSGSAGRISCRSYEERGITRQPTRHEGPDVRDMEKRGFRTAIGDYNREAHRTNAGREHREQQRKSDERRRWRGRDRDDRDDDMDRDL